MKQIVLIMSLITAIFKEGYCKEEVNEQMPQTTRSVIENRMGNYGIEFNVNSFSNNYGIGFGINTPYFWSKRTTVRLTGSYSWVQGTPLNGAKEIWAPYGLLKVGIFSGTFNSNSVLRTYGGGGMVFILPSNELSHKNMLLGGFGLIGLEIFYDETSSVFVELGGMATGATADQFTHQQIYANGFISTWGLRQTF